MDKYIRELKEEIDFKVSDIIDHYEMVIDDLKQEIENLKETISDMEAQEKSNE